MEAATEYRSYLVYARNAARVERQFIEAGATPEEAREQVELCRRVAQRHLDQARELWRQEEGITEWN